MRAAWATAIALALLVPAAAALGPLAAPRAAPEGGCEERPGLHVCSWTFSDENVDDVQNAYVFDLPVHPVTLASFEVELVGRDNGWTVLVESMGPDGTWRSVTRSTHLAAVTDPGGVLPDLSYRHKSTAATVIFGAGLQHRVTLVPFVDEANNDVGPGPRSIGRWSLTYNGELAPAGERPYRPAADAERPQLRDLLGDVDQPERDIVAAWFADERVGDELFDVHLRLAALPDRLDFSDALGGSPGASRIGWKLAWRLGNTTYFVEWIADRNSSLAELETHSGYTTACELRSEVAQGQQEPVHAQPACAWDAQTGTLSAVLPERSVGSPRAGVLFEDLAARTRVYSAGRDPDVVDDATVPEHLFALGGPDVWAQLDRGALGPASPPWYEAPLAEENLVDSFQILASFLAATTFLAGLAIVAKRRRRTNALLHRIDDAIRGDIDSRETLLRLGRLETEFSEMYRRNRLTEGQYQMLSQRIATLATRHALRHSLGLDDGVPGDATPVRIDVADGPKKRIRP